MASDGMAGDTDSATDADTSSMDGGDGGESGDADGGGMAGGCEAQAGDLPFAEGDYVPQGDTVADTRAACRGRMHATAGADGSTLAVSLTTWDGPSASARVRIEDLLGQAMVDWTEVDEGERVEVSLDRSGEVLVRIEPVDVDALANDYGLSVTCVDACEREYTRYPTVFMHGMAGTDAYLDVLDYWFRVEPFVREPGYLVFMPAVDAFEATTVRAQQWMDHLDALVLAGQGRRFNLIAHSQGGLDARYLASELDAGSRVASITTIATPHRGTAVADVAAGVFDGFPVSTALVESILGLLGGLVGLSGSDLSAQIADLSRPAMEAFNEEILDVPGVVYASWAGRSCASLDLGCRAANGGEVVESLFAATLEFLELTDGPNDGLVPVDSAKWGEYLGEIPADHMDEVGQIADVFNGAFDHRQFYLDELRRLAGREL